ncbi:MAG: malate dehydrogenase (quinone) [Gemmatimonadaceae bacterium]|nr:malate dehydrogenase (quinone) [Chitinophagaceae bacterium]
MELSARNGTDTIVLIGAGIMSATLGIILKELQPGLQIHILERLDIEAAESSDAWNNAGTGHSAFCELNYTPELSDGSIDISKAVRIAESFEVSKQFWSYLVQRGILSPPQNVIRRIPHMSFVWGEEDKKFLKKRYNALQQSHLFEGMIFTEDDVVMKNWMPLIMEGRKGEQVLAATRMDIGTDVNFGSLTKCVFDHLKKQEGVSLYFNNEVTRINRDEHGWKIGMRDLKGDKMLQMEADFVFIGAGGGSLPLLLKSGIPEGRGFGGFPVSGQWLKCTNEKVIAQHNGKVYGKAAIGAPPMSVPHLDTRIIKGKKELLFGPYAGFTTKFLKKGSFFDLVRSIKWNNIKPMLSAGFHNIPLTRYLIDQVRQSPDEKLEALRQFYKNAAPGDWEMVVAGQRVQVIKKDEEEGGILEFGTEVVSAADGSLAALLGASPGASTAVSIMLSLLEKCFPEQAETTEWKEKLTAMIPSYGKSLSTDRDLALKVRQGTAEILGLTTEAN